MLKSGLLFVISGVISIGYGVYLKKNPKKILGQQDPDVKVRGYLYYVLMGLLLTALGSAIYLWPDI